MFREGERSRIDWDFDILRRRRRRREEEGREGRRSDWRLGFCFVDCAGRAVLATNQSIKSIVLRA